jgi:glycosyltransferase involved in cell wall biosynthesis
MFKGKKILLSLHDFRPASGACHQPAECTNFRDSCQNCPAVTEFARKAVEKRAVENKSLLSIENVHLVAPSRWMGDLVESSFTGQTKAIDVLPNISRTVKTSECRPKRESILIVSSTAQSSLRRLSKENLARISAFASSLEAPLISVGANSYSPPALNRGVVSQAELESEIGKAHVVVVPSRWESFSQIAATAIKLQTPVCSFRGGAVEEMAEKYGLFVDLESTDLARAYRDLKPSPVPLDLFADEHVVKIYKRLIQLPWAER